MFDPVDPRQSLPDLEEGILQYWREEDTFKRSVRQRQRREGDILDGKRDGKGDEFSFYDGPPFATGLPHYGHLLAGTIKDVIPRYQTMRGKAVQRRFGWDCHGLPVENIIEKENNITDHKQIEEMGIGVFNDLCKKAVLRYSGEWKEVVERMGRWVDMDWDYRTMDPDYMESIWWVFSELAKKKMIYEGHKPMHICPRCVTPLSNFEVTQGYQDITDQSVYATFPLTGEKNTEVIAWTTTPWTLPGNLFLAINSEFEYAKVSANGKTYIVAKERVPVVFKDIEHEVVGSMKAKDLLGKTYEPLFPYFTKKYGKTAFKIVAGDFVTIEDGTGVVHIAPGFGTDDYEVGKREKAELLQHVTMDGRFISEVTDFADEQVKPKDDPAKMDRKIGEFLLKKGRALKTESYRHSYPHCWRCDTPLLNYATSSWFVAVEEMKEKMLTANEKTEWVPGHVRDGRFGRWLEGARDWAISRNRYWGTPLPIWRTEKGDDMTVIGSRDDLMKEHKIRFTKITALRHAESEGNLVPIYQGKTPGTDLTKNGKEQAAKAADFLKDQEVSVVYCSPLNRAKQTAEIVAKKTGAKVIVDERLAEVEFGDYEGKTVDFSDLSFLKARRMHKLETGKPESVYHFEGMETWDTVHKRISSFLNEILPRHRSEHVVVVTHADPLMNIKQFFSGENALKLSHQPYPRYASPVSFFWDHDSLSQMDLHKQHVDTVAWQGSKVKDSVNVTLVRHGQTDLNKNGMIQGSEADYPLNDTGREQVAETAKKLKKQKFDLIISSDLKRAVESAEIIAKELGIPYEHKWFELRERSMGVWSGQNYKDVNEAHPFVDPSITSDAFHHVTPENGESLSQFLARIRAGMEKIQMHFAGKKILVVAHGGAIRAFQALKENMSYVEAALSEPKNASTLTFDINPFIKRIPEVLDCWFESGSMPYAEKHFPFEMHHADMKKPEGFPADFIAEGMDQTRGWFYTLTVLGTALFNSSPFQNCVVNGIVLAEDGKKMSKRLKNYPEPMEIVKKHGADAVRFTLMSSPAVRGEDLRFSEKLVQETVRNMLLPLWNTYSFFVTYANAAKFEPTGGTRRRSSHPLDLWIRAEMQDLVNRMTKELDRYELSGTCAEIHDSIDALTNWYVRLSRRRFAGKGAMDSVEASGDREEEDQKDALTTLHDVLITLSQLLAPFTPYITEAIYLNLVKDEHGSIHFTDWPETRKLTKEEDELIEENRIMRLIVSLGLGVRSEQKIKTRQPLLMATIALPPAVQKRINLTEDDLQLLRQELNVKEIEFSDDPESLADSYVQVDARKVGPRLGARVQEMIKAGKEGEFSVRDDGMILILDEEFGPEEAEIKYRGKEGQMVAANHGVVVSLNTTVTKELELEGVARDVIRAVQKLRKESGLSFTDTIKLQIDGIDEVVKTFGKIIEEETRAVLAANSGEHHTIELEDGKVTIAFEKR